MNFIRYNTVRSFRRDGHGKRVDNQFLLVAFGMALLAVVIQPVCEWVAGRLDARTAKPIK